MDANTATEIVSKVNDWVEVAGLILMAIVVVTTVLVKLAGVLVKFTATTADDEKVARAQETVHYFANGILNALVFFPTLGKNPRTKMLEAKLKELDPKVVTVKVGLINETKASGDEPKINS